MCNKLNDLQQTLTFSGKHDILKQKDNDLLN